MKAKHFIAYLVLFIASGILFSFCEEEVSEDVTPLVWTSDTHHVKMKNKYTHEVYIDAAADTLQFIYSDNYLHFQPYISCLKEQDQSFQYEVCMKSKTQENLSYYFAETHEQHISRPAFKADLKDSVLAITVAENTSGEQRFYSLTIDDSKYGGGCPSLGYILIIQKGKSK